MAFNQDRIHPVWIKLHLVPALSGPQEEARGAKGERVESQDKVVRADGVNFDI